MRYLIALLLTGLLAACDSQTGDDMTGAEGSDTGTSTSNAGSNDGESNVVGEEVTYQVGDTNLTGYIAYDASQQGERPGVLVVHEWWGHNEYVRNRAHMLAKLGYTAFAVDMYGDGKKAEHPDDAQKFMQEVMSNMDVTEKRFNAAQNILEQHNTTDSEKIAAIGYCMGGGIVLHMARQGADLDGVASFHGMLDTETPAKAHAVKADILVAHGAEDPFVTDEQVAAFKKEMDAAVADYEFIEYEGAKHGFTNPSATELGNEFELPLAYNEEADEKSWNELKDFLNNIFN